MTISETTTISTSNRLPGRSLPRPLRSRLAVAAVPFLAAGLLAACGEEGEALDPSPAAVGPAAPTSTEPASTPTASRGALPALFPSVQPREVGLGVRQRFDSGVSGELTRSGQRVVLTVDGGDQLTGDLPEAAVDPTLLAREFDLGQAGAGWMVRQEGGDSDQRWLMVGRGDDLVPAVVEDGVPFGSGWDAAGLRHRFWVTADWNGLYTAVQQDDPSSERYRVYSWEVTGPGEGGTRPDDPTPSLVPTDLGIACLDFAAETYERC
ncbi:hypothetical protein [Nocardioides sp. R-C-SC26]|uniref:hypothetical protein n=1 Tax=Nocardioides sp. R-C-SC26 TaxID=2870414 RepID=UPI001E2E294A|nr:hypothetical protein [Nocardioides sp. R-C-SC26]